MIFSALSGVISYMSHQPLGEKLLHLPKIFRPWQLGHVNILIALMLFLGALFGSPLGIKLQKKIHPRTAKKLFAALLVLVAGKIFWELS